MKLPATWTCHRCGWTTTNRNDIRWGMEIGDCRRCNPDDPDRPNGPRRPRRGPRRPRPLGGGGNVTPKREEELA